MREDLQSRSKQECSARPRVSRISTGLLVRFVALLVRFTGKAVQSMTRFRHAAPGACEGSANANLAERMVMAEGARMLARVPGPGRSVRPTGSRARFFMREEPHVGEGAAAIVSAVTWEVLSQMRRVCC